MNSIKLQDKKVNKQKLLVFLYMTKNNCKKNKEKIPFLIASKTIRHLGINLTKKAKVSTLKTIKYW